jgi:hypothetical protein
MVLFRVATTFTLICLAWIFFRSKNLPDAWYIITHLASGWSGAWQSVPAFSNFDVAVAIGAIVILESVQWLQETISGGKRVLHVPAYFRWSAYYSLLASILVFGVFDATQFIYFQF